MSGFTTWIKETKIDGGINLEWRNGLCILRTEETGFKMLLSISNKKVLLELLVIFFSMPRTDSTWHFSLGCLKTSETDANAIPWSAMERYSLGKRDFWNEACASETKGWEYFPPLKKNSYSCKQVITSHIYWVEGRGKNYLKHSAIWLFVQILRSGSCCKIFQHLLICVWVYVGVFGNKSICLYILKFLLRRFQIIFFLFSYKHFASRFIN